MPVIQNGFRWLALATLGLWLLLAGPAYFLAGLRGLEGLTYAALLCLIPARLVFYIGSRYQGENFGTYLAFGGALLRMFFALGGALAVRSFRGLEFSEFLVWLAVFYIVVLVLETLLLLRQPS